jgi:hypothetical protein
MSGRTLVVAELPPLSFLLDPDVAKPMVRNRYYQHWKIIAYGLPAWLWEEMEP